MTGQQERQRSWGPTGRPLVAARRKPSGAVAIAALLLWIAGLGSAPVHAAGAEASRRADDLFLSVDSRWAGGRYGGYFPVRIRITNTGRARVLQFRFRGDPNSSQSRLPTVERYVSSAQNATDQFTLSIPLVGAESSGRLEVLEDGRAIEGLTTGISAPDPADGQSDQPALLVISTEPVDCSLFERGVAPPSSHAPTYGRSHVAGYSDGDSAVVAPNMLPENWIDYSGLDLVAIPLPTLERVSPGVRSALLKWTQAGGTLLVYNTGKPVGDSSDLDRLLELTPRQLRDEAWAMPDRANRVPVPEVTHVEEIEVDASQPPPKQTKPQEWSYAIEPFARRELMRGLVVSFTLNPFPGSATDWRWLLNGIGPDRWRWTARTGMNSRNPSQDFSLFNIPGVAGVPRYAMLSLITLFTIVIGPVNFVLLKRRRQLFLLPMTIPLLALVTVGALFGYAMIADGFRVQSRIRSVTFLDQERKAAVSVNRMALYAGLVPSDGLRFSPDTAVLPIWSDAMGLRSGRVDWSETQHLAAGWVRSRTLGQFETISHRAERARLDVESTGDGSGCKVANGFPWSIRALLLRDEQGRLFFCGQLPAGSSTQLAEPTSADRTLITSLIETRPDADVRAGQRLNDGGYQTGFFGFMGRRPSHYYNGRSTPQRQIAASLLERQLAVLSHSGTESPLKPRSYLAILQDNPGIDTGLAGLTSSADLYVIHGKY